MSHGRHVRVVVEGIPEYNLGGDTSKQLREQVDNPEWNPLVTEGWPLILGVRNTPRNEVTFVRLIYINRTRGNRRRITEIHQYQYDHGKLTGHYRLGELMVWNHDLGMHLPALFNPTDPTYKFVVNDMNTWENMTPVGPFEHTTEPDKPKRHTGFLAQIWEKIMGK